MTNQTSLDVQQKHQQTIANYVGDMVALESHIEEALDRQLTETQDDAEARAAVQRFHDLVKQHRDTLTALQEQVGGGIDVLAVGVQYCVHQARQVLVLPVRQHAAEQGGDEGTEQRVEQALGYGSLHDAANYTLLTQVNCALHAHALLRRDVAHLIFPDEVQTLPAPDGAQPGGPDGRRTGVVRVGHGQLRGGQDGLAGGPGHVGPGLGEPAAEVAAADAAEGAPSGAAAAGESAEPGGGQAGEAAASDAGEVAAPEGGEAGAAAPDAGQAAAPEVAGDGGTERQTGPAAPAPDADLPEAPVPEPEAGAAGSGGDDG